MNLRNKVHVKPVCSVSGSTEHPERLLGLPRLPG